MINGSITGAESISCGGTYLYDFVGGVLGSPTYSWQSSGHFTQGVSGNTVALTPVYSREGYTSVNASNACGTSYLCQTICSTGCDTGLLNFPGSNPCATSGLCGFSLMRVSPNPSSDKLTIKANMKLDGSESKKTFVATISDDQGNTVLSRPLDEEELVIDKGFLKAGTYYVRISLEGRIMGTKRIIIE